MHSSNLGILSALTKKNKVATTANKHASNQATAVAQMNINKKQYGTNEHQQKQHDFAFETS